MVKLTDGPCEGQYAKVLSFGTILWQKVGKREGVWAKYLKNLYKPGEYVWSGQVVTDKQMQEATKDRDDLGFTTGA